MSNKDRLPPGWGIHEVCNVVRWVAQTQTECKSDHDFAGACWAKRDRKAWCMPCLAKKLVKEAEE